MQSDQQRRPPSISTGVWIIIWIVILMLMIKFFDNQVSERNRIVQHSDEPGIVVLKRAPNGHYFARGFINQAPVVFILRLCWH